MASEVNPVPNRLGEAEAQPKPDEMTPKERKRAARIKKLAAEPPQAGYKQEPRLHLFSSQSKYTGKTGKGRRTGRDR